jgi:hypothetical protein
VNGYESQKDPNADPKEDEYCILTQVCIETNAKSKRRMSSSIGAHSHSSGKSAFEILTQSRSLRKSKGQQTVNNRRITTIDKLNGNLKCQHRHKRSQRCLRSIPQSTSTESRSIPACQELEFTGLTVASAFACSLVHGDTLTHSSMPFGFTMARSKKHSTEKKTEKEFLGTQAQIASLQERLAVFEQ